MRIFNLHDDIGKELITRKESGKPLSFRRSHMNRLKRGEILTSAAACWFDGTESFEQMTEMIAVTSEEIQKRSRLILSADDLDETASEPEFLLTVEGMCGIESQPKQKIIQMYEMGVRMASLTWNETNRLGTGVDGDPARGLTKKGKKAIRIMNRIGMIVDVSHTNECTFWDILRISKKPVIASHSNCRSLCNVGRNLTDQQIVALAEKGGIIGLNAFGRFISENPKKVGARTLAKHARHIASIAGHEHIACGFDFTDYLEGYEEEQKHDLFCAKDAQNFLSALQEEGFTEEEIKDIAYRNAFRFFRENL